MSIHITWIVIILLALFFVWAMSKAACATDQATEALLLAIARHEAKRRRVERIYSIEDFSPQRGGDMASPDEVRSGSSSDPSSQVDA
jgi:hypothetical protein